VPLISASIIAWFLCVMVPSFDISLTFAFSYFAYVLWLCGPRLCSQPLVIRDSTNARSVRHRTFVLNLSMMKAVYLIPIIVCPGLYAATSHNVLFSSSTHVMEFAVSILWPVVLMSICAQRHMLYWPAADEASASGIIGSYVSS
jgi:hypothetical protein